MKHEIGDCLYYLRFPFDEPGPEEVRTVPVVKITDRYVWIGSPYSWDQERGKLNRLDRAKLESEGNAYCRPLHELFYVRPLNHWPLLVVSVDGPRQLTA